MRDRSHDDVMAETFRADPAYAAELLTDILADGPEARPELLIALRQIAKSFGGVPSLAQAANLNPTSLYRMLSANGNPTLDSITAILRPLGLRLAVAPVEKQPVNA